MPYKSTSVRTTGGAKIILLEPLTINDKVFPVGTRYRVVETTTWNDMAFIELDSMPPPFSSWVNLSQIRDSNLFKISPDPLVMADAILNHWRLLFNRFTNEQAKLPWPDPVTLQDLIYSMKVLKRANTYLHQYEARPGTDLRAELTRNMGIMEAEYAIVKSCII